MERVKHRETEREREGHRMAVCRSTGSVCSTYISYGAFMVSLLFCSAKLFMHRFVTWKYTIGIVRSHFTYEKYLSKMLFICSAKLSIALLLLLLPLSQQILFYIVFSHPQTSWTSQNEIFARVGIENSYVRNNAICGFRRSWPLIGVVANDTTTDTRHIATISHIRIFDRRTTVERVN